MLNEKKIEQLRSKNNAMAEECRQLGNKIDEVIKSKRTIEMDLETKYKCKNGHPLRMVRNEGDGTAMCDGCMKNCIHKDKVNFFFKCNQGCNTDYCPCCFYLMITGKEELLKKFKEEGGNELGGMLLLHALLNR